MVDSFEKRERMRLQKERHAAKERQRRRNADDRRNPRVQPVAAPPTPDKAIVPKETRP